MGAVHNDRMLTRARRQVTGIALAAALVLTGCSGSEDEPSADDPSESSSGGVGDGPTDYLEVPAGVELTPQGSELSLGDAATVAFEPRQGEVAALDLTVQDIQKASFKLFVGWKLQEETLTTTPYFVHVKVKNVGDADLGGRRVPIYGVDGANKLVESSTFASTFNPCPSASLPEKFKQGDTFKTCLVYLAPDKGQLTATSFRPTEEFSPITWTGEITRPEALQPDKKSDKKGDKKSKSGKNGG